MRWIFYFPLALAGFRPWMFWTMDSINILYQFWIHMPLIGRVGWLELILNTPSHHRVHHGVNPRYLDRNYGGILIIWDRLFGTFVEETERPNYGLVKPLRSWNPLRANTHYFGEIVEKARGGTAWESIVAWVKPPEWRSRGTAVPQDATLETQSAAVVWRYVSWNHLTVIASATYFIAVQDRWQLLPLGVFAALLLVTLCIWGGLLEGRR